MRSWFVLALIAAAACKGKPKHRPPPPELGVQATGSGSAAAPDISLPHGNGSPPKKLGQPVTAAEMGKLVRVGFHGFQLQHRALDPIKGVEVRQTTEDHPRIVATITISRCDGGVLGECVPLDPAKWKLRIRELEQTLTPELRELPDTTFEIGSTLLYKVPVIFTYQLAFAPLGTGSGRVPGLGSGSNAGPAQSQAYTVYFNDGINQIRVIAEYGDTPKHSRAELAAEVTRDDLEAVAKSFLDIYTQLW